MQDFYIAMIVVGVIFLAVVVLLAFLLFRQRNKRRTSVRIIKSNNRIRTKNFYGSMKEKFDIDGHTYVYNHSCEIKRGFGFDIFYFEESPHPINMNGVEQKTTMSSKNLHNLMKNDLIEKLFNSQKDIDSMKVYMLIIGLVSLATLLVVLIYKPSIDLSGSPNNIAIIEQAIRNVIR